VSSLDRALTQHHLALLASFRATGRKAEIVGRRKPSGTPLIRLDDGPPTTLGRALQHLHIALEMNAEASKVYRSLMRGN